MAGEREAHQDGRPEAGLPGCPEQPGDVVRARPTAARRSGGLVVRDADRMDADWLTALLTTRWGSPFVVTVTRTHDLRTVPAVVAELHGKRAGLATWHVEGDGCELLSIDSTTSGCGVGTALLATVTDRATRAGCSRLWCVTTNDNTVALRFYQRRGWRITAWRQGAVDAARAVKPEIPLLGLDDIPIRDEIELELRLDPRQPPGEAAGMVG